jgi:hypothetical protein
VYLFLKENLQTPQRVETPWLTQSRTRERQASSSLYRQVPGKHPLGHGSLSFLLEVNQSTLILDLSSVLLPGTPDNLSFVLSPKMRGKFTKYLASILRDLQPTSRGCQAVDSEEGFVAKSCGQAEQLLHNAMVYYLWYLPQQSFC